MTTALWAQIGLAMVGLVCTLIVGIIGFLISRTLAQIDRNQTELFERVHEAEKTLYVLKGEHDRNHLSDMKVVRPTSK